MKTRMTKKTRTIALIARLRGWKDNKRAAADASPDNVVLECSAKTAEDAEWHGLFVLLNHNDLLEAKIDTQLVAKRVDELRAAMSRRR